MNKTKQVNTVFTTMKDPKLDRPIYRCVGSDSINQEPWRRALLEALGIDGEPDIRDPHRDNSRKEVA